MLDDQCIGHFGRKGVDESKWLKSILLPKKILHIL
jgi:hypothetical protein